MQKIQTNSSDWSALVPIELGTGPKQAAIYEAIRRLIETRGVGLGQKLPPTRELASRFGASRGAVVAAYDRLAADGYAEARRGAGTFVALQVPAVPATTSTEGHGRVDRPNAGRLGSGTADEATLRVLRKLYRMALSRPTDSFLNYGDPQGSLALRVEVATYLRTVRGMRVDPSRIVITSGTQSALDLVARTALRPGDRVWMEDPCYRMAHACLHGAGLDVVPVPVDAGGLDPEAGQSTAPDARAVFLTPSHQYPLGVTLTMPRRMALLNWAASTGAWIIEDDYDSEFRYTGPPLAALHGMDHANRVIYLASFAKAIAPGLRLGYAVLPPELMGPFLDLRRRTDRYPNALSETVLAAFLRDGHFAGHLRRARRKSRAARDMLVSALSGGPFEVEPPSQGLHLIARPAAGLSAEVALRQAERTGLFARSLSEMYLAAPPEPGLVIGFSGIDPEALGSAARRFVASVARHS